MRISDWSSDVCSSDLGAVIPEDHAERAVPDHALPAGRVGEAVRREVGRYRRAAVAAGPGRREAAGAGQQPGGGAEGVSANPARDVRGTERGHLFRDPGTFRSEERRVRTDCGSTGK